MDRRTWIASGMAAGGLGVAGLRAAAGREGRPARGAQVGPVSDGEAEAVPADAQGGAIDSNVSLFRWPFRRLPLDEPRALAARLGSLGFSEAWASSYEGLLHRDLRGVNERLAEACASLNEARADGCAFLPVGVLNPLDPRWEGEFAWGRESYGMRVFRLHPGWHGYALDDERVAALVEAAQEARALVQISALLEDVRTQHPLVRVEEVDLGPLPELLERFPQARVQVLNARLRGAALERMAGVPQLLFDTARSESTGGVRALAEAVGTGRVLHGSHAPFLIPEAALVRLAEAALDPEGEEAVLAGNARRALAEGRGAE